MLPPGNRPKFSLGEKALLAAYSLWTIFLVRALLATAATLPPKQAGGPRIPGTAYYIGMLSGHLGAVAIGAVAVAVLLLLASRSTAGGRSMPRIFWWLVGPVMVAVSAVVWMPLAERMLLVAVGAAIFAVAVGAGGRIVALVAGRIEARGERLAFSAAVGLWAMGITGLLLASLGLTHRLVVLALLAGGAVEFRGEMRAAARDVSKFLAESSRSFDFSISLGVTLLGMLAAAVALSAMFPPTDYDVIEYHLALPREFLAARSAGVAPHNVFSGMPLGSEMLSLIAMALVPGRIEGAYLAKVLVGLTGLSTAVAAYAMAARLAGRRAGMVAAIALVWSAGSVWLYARAYSEPLLTLQALAAFGCLMSMRGLEGRARLRRLLLTGLLCGCAAGTKYTGYIFVFAPVLTAVAVGSIARGRGGRRAIFDGLLVSAAFCAAVWPWLLRNMLTSGDPLYPLLASRFGAAGWSPERGARFVAAHSPRGFGLGAIWKALGQLFGPPSNLTYGISDSKECHMMSAIMALFVPFGAWFSIRRWRGGTIWAIVAGCLVLWFCFTHRLPRFGYPFLALLAVMAGCGYGELCRGRIEKVAAGGLAAWVLATSAGVIGAGPGVALTEISMGHIPHTQALERFLGSEAEAFRQITTLPEGSKVLLVAEAQTFYIQQGKAGYRTVFDGCELAEVLGSSTSARAAARELARRGYTHVYFNWKEFQRLETTYAFDHGGSTHGGYADLSSPQWEKLRALVLKELETVWQTAPRRGPVFAYSTRDEIQYNTKWARLWGRRFASPAGSERLFVLARIRAATGGRR